MNGFLLAGMIVFYLGITLGSSLYSKSIMRLFKARIKDEADIVLIRMRVRMLAYWMIVAFCLSVAAVTGIIKTILMTGVSFYDVFELVFAVALLITSGIFTKKLFEEAYLKERLFIMIAKKNSGIID